MVKFDFSQFWQIKKCIRNLVYFVSKSQNYSLKNSLEMHFETEEITTWRYGRITVSKMCFHRILWFKYITIIMLSRDFWPWPIIENKIQFNQRCDIKYVRSSSSILVSDSVFADHFAQQGIGGIESLTKKFTVQISNNILALDMAYY